MKVFVVNGQGNVGKDSFEGIVEEWGKINKYKCKKISMIDMVKDIATSIGWDGSKDLRDRLFLCNLKQLFAGYNDSPYQVVKTRIKNLEEEGLVDVLFVDAREPSDIDRLVKDFNAKTILVKDDVPAHYGNPADDNVFNYTYDFIIDNSGTLSELVLKAIDFSEKNIKEKN